MLLLRETAALDFEGILDAIEEPVLLVGRDYRLIGANQAARKRYQWSGEGQPQYCFRLTHASERPCWEVGEDCPVRNVHATDKPSRVIHLHATSDGGRTVEEVIASPIRDEDGNLICVVEEVRDLSQYAEAVIARLSRELKTLRGILPMCASCKRIRDADGSWVEVDAYISANTEANFTHGLCPVCVAVLYPDHDSKR